MSAVADRLSADAYLARQDPRHTELIDEAIVVNQPTVLHQQTVGKIHAALDVYDQWQVAGSRWQVAQNSSQQAAEERQRAGS